MATNKKFSGGFGPCATVTVETAPTKVPAGHTTTGATHTAARIAKLLARGLTCAGVARKIGRPGEIERVHKVGCNCPPEKTG